eukprot:1161946-Pelagomonas_calceolata.AAC.1
MSDTTNIFGLWEMSRNLHPHLAVLKTTFLVALSRRTGRAACTTFSRIFGPRHCVFPSPRETRKKSDFFESMGFGRVASSSPCLILAVGSVSATLCFCNSKLKAIGDKKRRNIIQYRAGTLINQKHAVSIKRSKCPLERALPGSHQSDSTLQVFSGCQNHITSSIKTEGHNVVGRMTIKDLSKSLWGAGLVNTDIGSDDRLVQHNLQILAQASNRILPPYLLSSNFHKMSRLISSLLDALLITFYYAISTSSSSSSPSSHHVLRSRHGTQQRSNIAARIRQPNQLSANQQHIHLVEIKYCEDARPGQQLEALQRQHADLCKRKKNM